MKRVTIAGPGGYDRLELETVPDLAPRPGEVSVRTDAVGVNFADSIIRMGLYESAKKYVGWPITPGFEFSGIVDAVGSKDSRWKVGDEVFGVTRFGGYATQVVVPEHQLFAQPQKWSKYESAAFPAVFLTAYYALVDLANVRKGQTILVHSAAGGVGTALLQLARVLGLRAVGVVGSSKKVQTARELGAAAVIDKSTQDLWREAKAFAPNGYDVVLDANGLETLGKSYDHLASPGKLVVYGFHSMFRKAGASQGGEGKNLLRRLWGDGRPDYLKLAADFLRTPRFNPLDLTNLNRSILAFNLSYLFDNTEFLAEAMVRMLSWVERGDLIPPTVTTFRLEDVADAHRAIESGTTVGKLVLTTSEGR